MRFLLLFGLITSIYSALAQEKCATNFIQSNQHQLQQTDQFESWLKRQKTLKQSNSALRQTVYEVPVVFQVIHDGSPLGSGSNLSDEKLIEQLEIVNQDFRRNNPDSSETPSIFESVAADTEISFVMARQDPEGLPTSGIVRKRGAKPTYSPNDDRALKAESAWPQDDYLNIYVTNLTGGNLGYAQFPFSNIDGIASELENYRSTDGIVLDYEWVGFNNDTNGFDSKGRTATHEIGHYLGLRHVWGDGGCGVDDFCDDTPLAATSTTGCPSNKMTCDTQDMIQNYMDYTNDECMNLFTLCQKSRMRTVLEESPRRKSLLTSKGLISPEIFTVDAGIKSIDAPTLAFCEELIEPEVTVRNRGTSLIEELEVALFLNDVLLESIIAEVSLDSLETTNISFSPASIDPSLIHEISFEILAVNGSEDESAENNKASIKLSPFENRILPLVIDFENEILLYERKEEVSTSYWLAAPAPLNEAGNQALMAPYHSQEVNFGLQDRMVTNTLDLSTLSSAQLDFKYAYANTPDEHLDGLIVAVSTDCGQTYPINDYIFERYGVSLNTASTTKNSFIPGGASDWDEISINLTKYSGQSDIQLAFIGVNGGGNNIYLDDIQITSANLLAYDLGVKSITNIPAVSCSEDVFPIIEVKNFGFETVEELELQVSVNDSTFNQTFTNLSLASGVSAEFLINVSSLIQSDLNALSFEILEVDGRVDEYPLNNAQLSYILINNEEGTIPIRENFDQISWTIHSPQADPLYEQVTLGGNRALLASGFSSTEISQSFLVTPTLNTSGYDELALRFDYSYAQRVGFNDNFKVLISYNCGRNYEELLSLNSEELAEGKVTEDAWLPISEDDWQSSFIDLTSHLTSNELRFAFVFTNGNGNNFYIDNIELLTNSDPDLPAFENPISTYPNPASGQFFVGLNLPFKQALQFKLIDMTGRVVYEETKGNLLNQTLTFNAPSQQGFYMLQVTGQGINEIKRILIRP